MIETTFSDCFGLFARAVPELLLLHLICGGADAIVHKVLNHHGTAYTSPRMAALASSLVALDSDWVDETNVDIAFRVANAIAFHRPLLTQEFKRKLMRQLDPARHAAEFDHLFSLTSQGLMYRHLTAELRLFWGARLDPEAPACDWNSTVARVALVDAMRRGPRWNGFQTSRAVVPPAVWDAAWRQRWWHRITGLCQEAFKNLKRLPEGSSIAVIVLVVLGMQQCSTRLRTPASSPPVPPSHQQMKKETEKEADHSQQALEKSLEELLKKAGSVKLRDNP